MALLFCKSSFYRAAILFWLFVSLAGMMLGALGVFSQTSGPPSPREASASREAQEKNITETASQAESGAQSNAESSQASAAGEKERTILKANFEKMKRDAGQLADLAKALQEELNKSNEKILPVDVVAKANKIEKLAKKIKGTARGF